MLHYRWQSLEGVHTACPHVVARLDVGHHDLPLHVQEDFSTLAIIHAGSGRKRVGNQSYQIRPRSIYIIHPEVPHAYLETQDLKLSNFCFTENVWSILPAALQALPGFQALFHIEPVFRGTRHYPSRLILDPDEFDSVIPLIESILPLRPGHPGESLMAVSRVTDLFARLSTIYERQHVEESSHELPMRVANITLWIERHLHEPIGVRDIAERFGISDRSLNRLFSEVFQISPKAFLNQQRLRRAAALLENSELNISEVALKCGHPDNNYFSRVFRKHFGCAPREYRRDPAAGRARGLDGSPPLGHQGESP